MQENRKNILISIGFVVILILVFIINILSKDKIISTSERRKLVQFPEITTKKVFDGTVSKDFEEYAMDQFVGRDLLRSIKSLFNFEIYRQKDNNKLFIENDSIYKIEYPLKEELIEKTAKRIEQIKEKYLKDAIAEYSKRLGRYCKLEIVEVADEKTPDHASETVENAIRDKEGERILKYVKEDSYVITLEIRGKMLTSEELSEKVDTLGVQGISHIIFIIGGSIGLGKEVLKRSDYALSFSKMTFPHQLMRVILLEQIYRSYRIINHEPYHK